MRKHTPRILDIGCATGDFLYFIANTYPSSVLTGIDVDTDLIQRARQEVPQCEFFEGNILEISSLPSKKYDAVFMNGVHSIFDDLKWLKNLTTLIDTVSNGRAYVFGIFNSYDLDVLVKVRASNQDTNSPWQAGWNCISKSTVKGFLNDIGYSCHFNDWTIGIDIPQRGDDPLRSWTFDYADGTKGIINGTMLLHTFSLLSIYR